MSLSSPTYPLALLLLLASAPLQPLPARDRDQSDKRTMSLTASGAIKTTPDKVDISTGVASEAKTAREALDQNGEAMTKVIEALKAMGIDSKDIQTTNLSVSPVHDQRPYDKQAPPVVVGYRVTNQVRISLHDTTRLGAILDKVVTLGSNQIEAIELGVDEPEALKDEARKLALKTVTDNAKLYAEAAGVGLGPILSISEEESSYQPHFAPAAARMESAKDVPIEAGTTAVEVRIRVTWEIN